MATRAPRSKTGDVIDDQTWGAVPPAHALAAQDALPDDDDEVIEQSPIERVMIALSETADPTARSRLMLYRIVAGPPGRPDRVEYCTDLTPAEFEAGGLGGIRDVWGPGTYEARLMGHKKGSPQFVRLAAPRFTLAPFPGVSTARAPDSSSAGIESALRALAETQARVLETLMEQRNVPPPNPVAQMQETLALMTTMREAMGLNNPPPPPVQQKSSISEIVEAFKELKEVSALINPGEQPEKSDVQQILELATPLVGMAQQAMQSQRAMPPVQMIHPPSQFTGSPNESLATNPVQLPHSGQAADATAAQEKSASSHSSVVSESVEDSGEQAVLSELQSHLSTLVSMAEKNDSIKNGANLVYDKLPDDWIELLHLPIWWQALVSAAPQVAPHEKWFAAVREIVVKMFAEDEEGQAEFDAAAEAAASR